MHIHDDSATIYVSQTKHWLDAAVIGLNLCPFAKAPASKNEIRYVLSQSRTQSELSGQLAEELALLSASPEIETTLLIHPFVLTDFSEYNLYLDTADDVLDQLELTGEIQIASFHPQYQFAGTEATSPENNTNRSPYPLLHLLREASIEKATQSGQEADAIVERNIKTMNELGHEGWAQLMKSKA